MRKSFECESHFGKLMTLQVEFVTSLNLLEEFTGELRRLKRSPWKEYRKGVWTHAHYNGKVLFAKKPPVVTVRGSNEIDLATKFVAWAMDHFGDRISTYVIR